MIQESAVKRMAKLLKQLRSERGISQLQLGDEAGVAASAVSRIERGRDARLATWDKLFRGLGYYLLIDVNEQSEEAGGLLTEEAERRRERRLNGLFAR